MQISDLNLEARRNARNAITIRKLVTWLRFEMLSRKI